MDEIRKLADQFIKACQREGIPALMGFGLDRIVIKEYAPDNTPERLTKARTTLVNTTKQEVRELEIEA